MLNKILITFALLFVFPFSLVYAQVMQDISDVSVALKAGTLGAGLEAETSFSDSFGARVGINYFTYSDTWTENDIDYDIDLNLLSVSALLDWHPFQGSFRVSGGALYNGNDIDMDSKSAATYQIGDTTYTSANIGNLTANVDFNDVAPYFGVGWDTTFGKSNKFGFLLELGAIYQGPPKVDLSISGPLSGNQALQNDLQAEEDKLKEDLDNFEYYPVLAVGFNYRY
jgi:hypothetical protein